MFEKIRKKRQKIGEGGRSQSRNIKYRQIKYIHLIVNDWNGNVSNEYVWIHYYS